MEPSRYAVCQSVLRGKDVSEQLSQARDAGIVGVAIDARSVFEHGADALAESLDAHDLVATSVIGCQEGDKEAGVLQLLDAAATLHAGRLLVIARAGRDNDAGADARFRSWLEPFASRAHAAGVRLLVEPLHPLLHATTRVHTLRHALSLVDGIVGAAVAVDTAHLWWDRFLLDDLVSNTESIGSVQLADMPGEALAEMRYARCALGAGVLPLADLIGAIEDAGYDGPYENEVLMGMPSADRPAFLRADREWFESL